MSAVQDVPAVELIVEKYKNLSAEDRIYVWRELARIRFSAAMREIANGPDCPMPVSDEELNEIVHEARAEVLRARGL